MKLQTTLVLLAVLAGCPPAALGQTYERVDVSTTGAFGNAMPTQVVLSDNGRIAAFSSLASNLVLPDDATSIDLYVRDRLNSTTVRIASDIGRPPGQLTAEFFNLVITGDGRWIAYSAWRGDHYETYVHDRRLGTTVEAASSLAEALPTGITPEGRYVAIVGRPVLYNTPYDAWRFDMQTGALLLASRNAQGGPAGAGLWTSLGTISADGGALVFSSSSPNLVPNDTNGTYDVFVFDASTSTVERVSIDDTGAEGDDLSWGGSISDDGSRVAFVSNSTNFAPSGAVFFSGAYVRDRVAGTTGLVSKTTAGVSLYNVLPPRITSDGRKVAFESTEPIAIPGDAAAGTDIFLHDIGSGVTSAVTLGAPTFVVEFLLNSVAAGGRWVTFLAANPNLPNFSASGGAYVADVGPACSAASYCSALPNSTGAAASIGSQGEPSLHFGAFTLTATSLPPDANAIFASSTSAVDPGVPFGNGLRCIGGTLIRHGVVHASAGFVSQSQDFSSPVYAGTRPGDVIHYQCVYRDVSAGGAAFNTTDALSVTFCY